MATDTTNPKSRVKVELKPGFHLMDWVRLNNSMTKGSATRKITTQELALHNKRDDCWTAYAGKVYNITQYLDYHPGGAQKLMLGAGKDCTALFNRYHRWVNGHSMLSNCIVGTYVDTSAPIPEDGDGEEDEKDEDNFVKPLSHKELMSQAAAKLSESDDT